MDISLHQVPNIVVSGIQSKTSLFFALHGLVYPLPSMAVNLPCLTGSLSQLPSFGISITRVSAQLLHRVVPSGLYSCRLLAHSLFVLLTLLQQQHLSVDVFLLFSALHCPDGHIPALPLDYSLSWLESGVKGSHEVALRALDS